MLAKIRTFLREHGWSTAAEIAVNFVLPYVIYLLMQKQFGDVKVLMAVAARSLLIQPFASAAISAIATVLARPSGTI